MQGGSGESTGDFSVHIKVDPAIIRVVEVFGTGQNLQDKLTYVLNKVITTRLLQLNARALKRQSAYLKKLEKQQLQSAKVGKQEQTVSVPVPKGIMETQQQLQALQKLLLSGASSHSGKSREGPKIGEIPLNVQQFIAIQFLGEDVSPKLDHDLVTLLLEEGNAHVDALNTQLAREIVGYGTTSGTTNARTEPESKKTLEDMNPALIQQKDLLVLLGNLEEVKERLVAQEKKFIVIRERIKPFADICAQVINILPEEILGATEKLLQKETPAPDPLSYEVLYDLFKENISTFNELAKIVALNKKQPIMPLETSNVMLQEKLVESKRSKKNERVSQPPEKPVEPRNPPKIARVSQSLPSTSLPGKISEETILDALTSEPQDIRVIITKMGITDMSDARELQLQLRELEFNERVNIKIQEGKKLYWKRIA